MVRATRYSLPMLLTLPGMVACNADRVIVCDCTPFPEVYGVVVTPSHATMNVGDKLQFAASVNADSGLVRTVTWSSSNSRVVVVDSAGTATALEVGVAYIVATSNADKTIAGAGADTVAAEQPVTSSAITAAGAASRSR